MAPAASAIFSFSSVGFTLPIRKVKPFPLSPKFCAFIADRTRTHADGSGPSYRCARPRHRFQQRPSKTQVS